MAISFGIVPLDPKEIAEVRNTFKLFDKDNNDMIPKEDVPKIWRSMGQNPTDKEMERILRLVDLENTGMVSWEEFYPLLAQNAIKTKPAMEEELREAFRFFDKDDDGYVNVRDLAKALLKRGNPLSQDEVREMLEMVQTDENGRVTYEAFIQAFTTLIKTEETE